MLWVLFAALSLVTLAPAGFFFARGRGDRGRQAAALALHRQQLVEVDRERDDGRIGPVEHAAAVLEIKRRLLAAGAEREPTPQARLRPLVIATVLCVIPLAALALYLPWGDPGLPAAPFAPRAAAEHAQQLQLQQLIATLKHRLKELDPKSAEARAGLMLLGRAEIGLGDYAGAAKAWRQALEMKFNPALAAAAAEAETRAAGRVDSRAAELFRASLAKSPANAPWSALARARLAEASAR
ncbi:MAG: c-type cytochrome biogenesis protein CcmI [Acetobacteraceae bacterium]